MRIEVFAFFIITRSLRFLPYEKAKSLNPDDLKPMASNVMGEKTISELMKTGNLLSQEPWGLLKTEQWLSDLCSRNQERKFADPIPLKFIFEPNETLLAIHLPPQDMSAEPVAQAPRPRQVEIVRPKKKAKAAPGMRRPGAALRRPAVASDALPQNSVQQDEAAGAHPDAGAADEAPLDGSEGPENQSMFLNVFNVIFKCFQSSLAICMTQSDDPMCLELLTSFHLFVFLQGHCQQKIKALKDQKLRMYQQDVIMMAIILLLPCQLLLPQQHQRQLQKEA